MPNFADYELWLTDWAGDTVDSLFASGRPGEFLSMTWQHVLNGMAVYRLEMVARTKKDEFEKHYGLRLMRDHGAGMYEEFYGIHLDSEEWLSSGDVDEQYWASMGYSPDWLLDQPLLQPLPNANPNFPRYDVWWMHGASDDVLKRMVSESMGGGAATGRQFSNLAVAGDTSEGAFSCYEGAYERLLEAMQKISGEENQVDFKVFHVVGGFEFRTYCPYYGADRRKRNEAGNRPTIFSLELGNVLEPNRKVLSNQEVTVAIGGWQGGGAEQDIYEMTNVTAIAKTPFSRREQYYDLHDITQADVIPRKLRQYLIDDGQREIVEFKPVETSACRYGRDWALGDLVTLELWDEEYPVRITEIGGRIDGSNEEQIVGKAELWTRDY